MLLCACYAMPGTDIADAPPRFSLRPQVACEIKRNKPRSPYNLYQDRKSLHLISQRIVLRLSYALSGTDAGYAPTRARRRVY
eukprot:1788835-Rhodomonas_salina.3